jgi:hypothetical protein
MEPLRGTSFLRPSAGKQRLRDLHSVKLASTRGCMAVRAGLEADFVYRASNSGGYGERCLPLGLSGRAATRAGRVGTVHPGQAPVDQVIGSTKTVVM